MKKQKHIIFLIALFSNLAFANQKIYETNKHPNANGAWVKVSYPAPWMARDNKSKSGIQEFLGNFNNIPVKLWLNIEHIPNSETGLEKDFKKMSESEFLSISNKNSMNSNVKNQSIKKIEFKSYPAFELIGTQLHDGNNFKYSESSKGIIMAVKNKIITLGCAVGLEGFKIDEAYENLKKVDKVCKNYFESLEIVKIN